MQWTRCISFHLIEKRGSCFGGDLERENVVEVSENLPRAHFEIEEFLVFVVSKLTSSIHFFQFLTTSIRQGLWLDRKSESLFGCLIFYLRCCF